MFQLKNEREQHSQSKNKIKLMLNLYLKNNAQYLRN